MIFAINSNYLCKQDAGIPWSLWRLFYGLDDAGFDSWQRQEMFLFSVAIHWFLASPSLVFSRYWGFFLGR